MDALDVAIGVWLGNNAGLVVVVAIIAVIAVVAIIGSLGLAALCKIAEFLADRIRWNEDE